MDFFFNMSKTKQPGEMPWQSFCQAMDEIGFVAVPAGGSAFNFQPKPGSPWNASAQFHRSHGPTTKIPSHHAHFHRAYLCHKFGWTSDTFVLKP
ncbi:hypothetical protein LTR85_000846 [Meristemomyces frigidus]|nr:hypothetical protein LTR85_000846 [Meristemomyces frigidus]